MIEISVKDLTVQRGAELLLEDLNFNIKDSQNLAILGASGSGKSLLLKALKGQLPHKGHIAFSNENIDVKPKIVLIDSIASFKNSSNTSTLYYQQRYNSYDSEETETLFDNLAKQGTAEEIDFWLQKFDLKHRTNAPLIQLSNGELKKMQLIHHLLQKPEILLLDKVFTGLDVKSRKELSVILDDLAQKGTKIILVTDQNNIPNCITHFIELEDRKQKTFAEISNLKTIEKHKTSTKKLPELQLENTFDALIKMQNVSVKYGDKEVLHNISWEVKPGESWQIKGHNGAGKSTLLSLINGDNPQSYSQEIYLFDRKRGSGESIWDIKKKIGYVSPELHNFFDRKTTVEEAIGSGFFDTIGLFRKLNDAQKEKASEWLHYFGLENKATKLLFSLSSGEQRLVLLARALVKNPPLLALDEAFQGLDQDQIESVLQTLEELQKEIPLTMLFISHYDEEVPNFVTKVMELNQGKATLFERK